MHLLPLCCPGLEHDGDNSTMFHSCLMFSHYCYSLIVPRMFLVQLAKLTFADENNTKRKSLDESSASDRPLSVSLHISLSVA